MKTLIVYYSLEGNTEYAAKRIARVLDADMLRLVPRKDYKSKGLAKFVWGGRSAMMAEEPELEDYDVDLERYDRIVIGFPVWAANVAPPIRTFVAENRSGLQAKAIAAFACQAGRGAEKALEKLKEAIDIDSFELVMIFNDPRSKRSRETDEMIDDFGWKLEDLAAEEEEEEESRRLQEEADGESGDERAGAVGAIAGAAGAVADKVGAAADKVGAAADKVGGVLPTEKLQSFFSDWNYKKHVKLCAAVYIPLIAIDMTVSYFVIKRLLDRE